MLASSDSVSPKNSPKNSARNSPKSNTPRLNVEKYLIKQIELVVPTSKSRLNLEIPLINQTQLVVPISKLKFNEEKPLISQSEVKLMVPTPRTELLVEKSLINQTELVLPTSRLSDNDKFKTTIETQKNGLQIGIESQSGFKNSNSSLRMQFNNKVPTYNNIVNSTYENYYVSEPLDTSTLDATINTTTSLVSGKRESKKELKLKQKAFEDLSCRNEYNFSMPISPKTPSKSSMPNFDYKRQCLLQDGEGIQEKGDDGAFQNESDGLALESNERECIFMLFGFFKIDRRIC